MSYVTKYCAASDNVVVFILSLDMKTAHFLELILSLRGSNNQCSLMGVMNHCHTNGGIRLLRSNILEPPCLLETILTRLDCVQEIVETPELHLALEVSQLHFMFDHCTIVILV
jgi:DNA mismatch repair protein MSH4